MIWHYVRVNRRGNKTTFAVVTVEGAKEAAVWETTVILPKGQVETEDERLAIIKQWRRAVHRVAMLDGKTRGPAKLEERK
jgi:hypothetical protein